MTEASPSPEHLLSGIDLFAGLSGRELRKVVKLGEVVQHRAGHQVAAEGRGAIGFHLLLSGRASVTRGATVLRELGPGDYFGEISMIDGRPRSATVTASEAMETLVISHPVFEQLLDDEPAFARGLLRLLCARLRAAAA